MATKQAQAAEADEEAPAGAANEYTPLLAKPAAAQIGSRFLAAAGRPAKTARNICDAVLFRELNPSFADHVELGIRAATALVLLDIPKKYQFGADSHTRLFIKRSQILSPSSMVQLVYTLYTSVGETISYAWGGIFGSFLGTFYPLLMFAIAPRGVIVFHPVDPAFWFGIVSGSLFVILCMWLNFSILTKIFALSTFVWHWMAFMKPEGGDGYSNVFAIKIDGPMIEGLLAATTGSLLAVLLTFVPYPIWATDRARATANSVVGKTTCAWRAALAFYTREASDPYSMAELFHCIEAMNAEMQTLQGHIDNALWECFGMSKMHRMRKMLDQLEEVCQESCFRLTSIVSACSVESWQGTHNTVMGRCKPQLCDVVERAHDLFTALVDCANRGELPRPGEERARLEQFRAALRASLAALAREFRAAKEAVELPELSRDLLEEHGFCFSVTNYGCLALQFYDYVCDPDFDSTNNNGTPLVNSIKEGFLSMFDKSVLFSKDNINFALKNSLSILLCFFVGVAGYSKMLPPYSAGIASTSSLLLSKFAGSAIKKNLCRLQGVVIGLVLGELGFALFGWCTLAAQATMSALLFLYVSSTLYFYYSGSAYGGITILMAAFGTKFFTRSCADSAVDPLTTYHSVVEVVICILIMGCVDTLFALGRPSEMAHKSMDEAWLAIRTQVQNFLDPAVDHVRQGHGELRGKIALAEYLGKEAEDEPRMWRSAWRGRVFSAIVECARNVRTDLANMEYSASDAPGEDGRRMKNKVLIEVLQMEQFKTLKDLVFVRLDRVFRLLELMIMDEEASLEDINEQWDHLKYLAAFEAAIEATVKAVNARYELERGSGETLGEDISCRLSIILLSLVGMRRHIRSFEEAVIRG